MHSKVKKTNLKGEVKYPIGAFSALFKRITEDGEVSDRQKGGKITGSVQFGYNIEEIRLAKTLLESVLSVSAFKSELSQVIIEAYIEAIDREVLLGESSKNINVTSSSIGALNESDVRALTKAEINALF